MASRTEEVEDQWSGSPQEVNVLAERMDKPQPATPHLAVKVESHQSFTTMGFWRAEVLREGTEPYEFCGGASAAERSTNQSTHPRREGLNSISTHPLQIHRATITTTTRPPPLLFDITSPQRSYRTARS